MIRLRNTLGALALVCVTLSCSDELGEGTNSQGNALAGQKGYVKIAINLPTSSGVGTKADDELANDQFQDGLPEEFQVNDAYLLLFEGSSELNAELRSWYRLEHDFQKEEDDKDNITSTSEVIQEIVRPDGDIVYGLVVLNNNRVLTFNASDDSGELVTYNDEPVESLSDLQEAITENVNQFIGSEKSSFTMTNAPIAKLSGSNSTQEGQSVTTLVPLDVFDTEEQARIDTDPDQIYVERVVAKVTVDYARTGSDELFHKDTNGRYYASVQSNGNYNGDKVYLDGWYLNVTNKKTKFVRDVSDWEKWAGYENSNTYLEENRFFGTTSPYRVYWAIDPNYSDLGKTEDELKANFNVYTAENPLPTVSGENIFGAPAYCLENTFTTDHMVQRETTGIVFKMTYLFNEELDARTFFVAGDDMNLSEPQYEEAFIEEVEEKTSLSGLSLVDNPQGGYYRTASDMQRLFSGLNDVEASTIAEKVGIIRVYENGATYYYAARIKHFGDYYTPIEGTYVDGVNEYTDAHLGRYGVVRNNWYEIVINDISGPGRPTPPDPTDPTDPDYPDPDPEDPDNPDVPDVPDDPNDPSFINCRVNILPWTVRKQAVHL